MFAEYILLVNWMFNGFIYPLSVDMNADYHCNEDLNVDFLYERWLNYNLHLIFNFLKYVGLD